MAMFCFTYYINQPPIKITTLSKWIVGAAMALFILNFFDEVHYSIFCIIHHGEHDEHILKAAQDDWEVYQMFYTVIFGGVAAFLSTYLLVYATTERK